MLTVAIDRNQYRTSRRTNGVVVTTAIPLASSSQLDSWCSCRRLSTP